MIAELLAVTQGPGLTLADIKLTVHMAVPRDGTFEGEQPIARS